MKRFEDFPIDTFDVFFTEEVEIRGRFVRKKCRQVAQCGVTDCCAKGAKIRLTDEGPLCKHHYETKQQCASFGCTKRGIYDGLCREHFSKLDNLSLEDIFEDDSYNQRKRTFIDP